MLDQASVRSTVKIKISAKQLKEFQADIPLWSEVTTVAIRTREGKLELRYRIEICNNNKSARLHWYKGNDVSVHWRHRCNSRSYSFSQVDKVIQLQPGSVTQHRENIQVPVSVRVEQYFEFQLDILVESDQVNLLGESIKDSFINDFSRMLSLKEMTDLVLTCGGKKFPCHRLVLSCRSKVFRAMFFGDSDFKEKTNCNVFVEDFQPNEVRQFLKFVYGRECDFDKADPWSLLAMADKYDIAALAKCCSKALMSTLSKENCNEYLNKASMYRAKELVKSVLDVALEGENIITDAEWASWAKQYPEMVPVLAANACKKY